jgi:membrane associated rhomboid family serine protease
MIAIPLTEKISWRNPPVITIAIIAINIFVFFVLQRSDVNGFQAAESFYFESGLDKIEIPLFIEFIEENRPNVYHQVSATDFYSDAAKSRALYHLLDYDARFLEAIDNGHIAIKSSDDRKRRESLRWEYDNLRKNIATLEYGFRPARPRMKTWLTTMYLHGGIGHLVGNMVFLWIVGCLIEYGCRRLLFAVIYTLGGLLATGFFWLLNSQSLVPLIGASGAISGIMGAFTVLYGFKRVRLFLNLGFYFNYLRFPALVMLPLWVGNELLQMVFNQGSHVAYAAHLGGLIGGAGLAAVVRRIPGLLDMSGFASAQENPVQPMVEKALEHMGRLEFSEARQMLAAAEQLKPDDEAILQHLFTIDRQDPGSPRIHQTAVKLLNCLCRQPESYESAFKVYRTYVKAVRTAKLGAAMYLRLCQVFCEIGQLDDAQRLVSVLVEKCPQLAQIPSVLLKLATAYSINKDQKSCNTWLNRLCRQYPLSSEAQIAKKQFEPNTPLL